MVLQLRWHERLALLVPDAMQGNWLWRSHSGPELSSTALFVEGLVKVRCKRGPVGRERRGAGRQGASELLSRPTSGEWVHGKCPEVMPTIMLLRWLSLTASTAICLAFRPFCCRHEHDLKSSRFMYWSPSPSPSSLPISPLVFMVQELRSTPS